MLGIRLIFINITVLLIYAIIILVLVCRINNIVSLMDEKGGESGELKQRFSEISRDVDEESDIDNYDQIMHKEFSMRESNDSRLPSLISSYSPPISFNKKE